MIGARVLVVEDERLIAEEMCDRLTRLGLVPVGIAATGDEALRQIETERPDLVLLDIRLKHGPDGVTTADVIDKRFGIPFVFITAQSDDATLERAQHVRPAGYLLKPFDDRTFRTTITLAFHEKREREKRAAARDDDQIARERLAIEATTDSLTGVWNRRMLVDQIRIEAARAAESRTPFSLLLVDLDTFKPINDRYGHVAGDAVLRLVAQRIQHAVRSYDGIGRYGGDEFLVVMPHADAQVAVGVAERIRAAIAESPMAWADDTLPLSVSIGVAVADRSVEPIVLVDIADRSLYAAKDAGRDSVGPVLRPTPTS